MLRFFNINDGLIRETEVAEPTQLIPLFKQAHWIDAMEPDANERELLSTLFTDNPPATDEIDEIEASARYFTDQDGLHVHSLFLTFSEGRHNTSSVVFILQEDRLISIRDSELADFRLIRMRARRGQLTSHSPSQLLVTVLDQKVENHADNLEDIHRQLETVSHNVLEAENPKLEEAISQLARLEDSNGKIRLCLMDTQRDISFLLKHLKEDPHCHEELTEVSHDIDTLMSHSNFLFDKINFLMDSTQGFINIEQNQIIKIFSIAAVVFLPPTLIASIYGMNFDFMPELSWPIGYPMALLLMIASGFAPYQFFKRKGWL